MKSRKQRRLEARQNGTKFQPQYNGNSPISIQEAFGVGNERFNNKFVDFTDKTTEVEKLELDVVAGSEMESAVINTEATKSKGLIARTKRLFGKK